MKIVFASHPFPQSFAKSLYLAGPTPRAANVSSWRPHALELLAARGYDGVVFVPEPERGQPSNDYDQQMDWELEAMRRSDVLLFWVPADKETLPALTTRVEFGMKVASGRIILGVPENAYKIGYMKRLADRHRVIHRDTLEAAVAAVLERLEAGAQRQGAECLIPLEIWRSRHFRQWYDLQCSAGHALRDVREVEWVFRVGPNSAFPLYIALHVAIEVNSEHRVKDNEVVVIRPDVVTSCVYCLGDCSQRDRFVVVKEYRASVMNEQGFVYELPTGSSFNPDHDLIQVAVDELRQEAGVELAAARFRVIDRRQVAATMIANQALLLAARLEPEEMDRIAARQGDMHGNESETERTYPYVLSRQEIIEGVPADYATLGQLSLVGRQ